MTAQNQRTFPRITAAVEVSYECGGGSFTDQTMDLSARGLYIVTGRPLEIGSTLTVSFNLPGFDHNFRIGGRVVRNRLDDALGSPAGMGIEFLDVDEEDERVLIQFVVQSQLTQKGY